MDELMDKLAELEAQNRALRRENAMLRSGIDTSAEYVSGFADGANLTTIWREAQCVDLAESFGVPVC